MFETIIQQIKSDVSLADRLVFNSQIGLQLQYHNVSNTIYQSTIEILIEITKKKSAFSL